jgi:hypothetical protein
LYNDKVIIYLAPHKSRFRSVGVVMAIDDSTMIEPAAPVAAFSASPSFKEAAS